MNSEENIHMDDNKFNDVENEQSVCGENVYYKSEQLVPLLGLDADQIRYRAKEYDEFLHTSKTKGGHLRFTDHDVEMLRTIQHLMDSGYSKVEIKSLLRDPTAHIVIAGKDADETEEIKALLAGNEYLIRRISAVMGEVVNAAVTKALSEQASQMKNIWMLEEKSRENELNQFSNSLEILTRQNELLMEQLSQKDEEIKSLKEEKNKKKFLGFFRRE